MSAYDPAAEAARWAAMAADLEARAQQAARLAVILRAAAEDPREIERERERHAARDRADGGARARVFPWKPPAAWARTYILNAAAEAEREAASLQASAAGFREIGAAIESDP